MVKIKNLLNGIKIKFQSCSKAERRIIIFCAVVFACFVLFLIISAVDAAVNGNWFFVGSSLFFQDAGDAFMDFFNVNYFVQDMDPYIESGSSYPPMVLLVAKIFQLIQGTASSAKTIQTSVRGVISLLIYLGIFFACSWFLLRVYMKRKNICLSCSILAYFALFVSAPMLFAIDRGNYLLYSFLFVGYFLMYYKSDKRWQRELSCLSLALAVSFKLYPAIFALLLFNKKDWLNLVKTALYSVILLVVPLLAFNGGLVENFKCFLQNVLGFQSQSNGYFYEDSDIWYLNGYYNTVSITGVVSIICTKISGVAIADLPSYVSTAASICAILLAVIVIVAFFMAEKSWVKVFLLTSAMTFVLNTNYEYNLIFFIFPLLMFLTDCEKVGEETINNKSSKIYYIVCFVLFTLIFIPLPMGYFVPKYSYSLQHGYPVLDLVQAVAYLLLTVILIYVAIKNFVTRKRLCKNSKTEAD